MDLRSPSFHNSSLRLAAKNDHKPKRVTCNSQRRKDLVSSRDIQVYGKTKAALDFDTLGLCFAKSKWTDTGIEFRGS
jgi:hypothetical protein